MANNALMLKGWNVLQEPEIDRDGRRIFSAEYELMPEACPECGVVGRLYRHGVKTVSYRDVPAFGAQSVIEARVVRFKCRDCGKTSMQPMPDIDTRRRMTKRLVGYIMEQGIRKTFSAVTRDIGVDEKTVRNICEANIRKVLDEHSIDAPLILGIDEMKLGERKLLDLIDAMNRGRVDRWLAMLPNRDRIKLVTIDMWGPYRAACKAMLPQARIVVDKWHIVSKANDKLDRVRARHRRIIGDRRNPHKGRLLLQTHGKNLSPMRRMTLDSVLLNTPLLNDAWTCKEGFYSIWEATDRADAEVRFEAWKATIPASVKTEFGDLAKTVENWREEIFTFFELPFTNAYTESRNRLVKDLQREGRGYSFERLRAKAILMRPLTSEPLILCESCLGTFPKTMFLNTHHIAAKGAVDGPRPMRLCPSCHRRFHIGEEVNHGGDSTS